MRLMDCLVVLIMSLGNQCVNGVFWENTAQFLWEYFMGFLIVFLNFHEVVLKWVGLHFGLPCFIFTQLDALGDFP